MRAPSRASETVSVPMWHCRCTRVEARDVAEPRPSKLTTSLRNDGSSVKRETA